MSQETILEEAQDLLLGLGSDTFLLSAFPDVVRTLAMKCPVFSHVEMVSTFWVAGQLNAPDIANPDQSMIFTDDTTDAQSSEASDFPLSSSLDNDGHMIGAYGMFERVVYTLSVTDHGTGVYDFAYWDGTFWQPLPLLTTPDFSALGTQTMAFVAPEDWRQGVPTAITFPVADGFDANLFWIRVRAVSAPGGLSGQDEIESASQAMFLTVPPKGNTWSDRSQAAGLFRLTTGLHVFKGQDQLESISQAMFLTIPPKGNTQSDKMQAASLFRFTPATTVRSSATQIRVDTAIYPLPDTLLSLVSVLYYPNELEPVPVAEGLDLLLPGWRTVTGTPTRYTQDLGPVQRVRIVPIPTAIGTLGLPIFTGAFGATVGPNNVILITLQVPEEPDFPPWFQSLVSYAVAAREARRLGESSDLALGAALEGVVDGLAGMMSGMWREDGQELSQPYTSPLRG